MITSITVLSMDQIEVFKKQTPAITEPCAKKSLKRQLRKIC